MYSIAVFIKTVSGGKLFRWVSTVQGVSTSILCTVTLHYFFLCHSPPTDIYKEALWAEKNTVGERASVDGGIVREGIQALLCPAPSLLQSLLPPCCNVHFWPWGPERSSSPMKVQECDVGRIIKIGGASKGEHTLWQHGSFHIVRVKSTFWRVDGSTRVY